MALRTFLILMGLLAACVGIVLLAWTTGLELYLYFPGRHRFGAPRPPTDPRLCLVSLAIPILLYFYSQHYALIAFTVVAASVVLGILIGHFVYAWTPSILQYLLSAATAGTAAYGWAQQEFFDY